MPYAYLKYPDGRLEFVEIITIGSGSAPPRPHPRPPLPGGPVDPGYSPPWAQLPVDPGYGHPIGGFPGGGPVDPGYSPPWAQIPVDPGYGHPIGGFPGGGPVDPGYSPPWAQLPVDPGYGIPIGGGRPGRGTGALVFPAPVTDPPAVPPEGMSPDSKQVLIWFGPGTKPATAWVAPYVSTGPVTPPA